MQIEQEQFKALKELAEIQSNIATARAEFLKLQETTEQYMEIREKEAHQRVIKVLKESRDALEETSKHHKELADFNLELQAYANVLKGLSIDVTALFEDFNKSLEKAEKDMQENHKLVAEVLKNIKIERVQVTEDRKLLKIEEKKIIEAHRLLKDRRETLERGFKELKKLKGNKKSI